MKFSLSWLREYLHGSYTKEDVEEGLVSIGLEVEEVIDEAKRLKDFIIAHIDHAEKHPDADRLKVCHVNTGQGMLNIVCGGKNARTGIKVVLARVGVVIPSTGQPIKLGKVRGVESQGMLCSADELLLDMPSDGIIEVETNLPVGSPTAAALGLDDVVYDISVTPNRADCFSVYGIARDLYAYFTYKGMDVKLVPYSKYEIQGQFDQKIKIHNHAPQACFSFYLTAIQNVKNVESPSWLRQKLTAIGLRPISSLVDVTNYLCFDLGRPLHVFDSDRVKGDIALRLSQKGEVFEALDDKTYTLDEGMLVICDDEGIISLAGVMGGKRTAVNVNTTNVLLESAWFDPVNIAQTGQKLNLISDARMRFERGVDGNAVELGMQRALSIILEICGGQASHPIKVIAKDAEVKEIFLSFAKLKKLTGAEIPPSDVLNILKHLGFEVTHQNDERLVVLVPSWRVDVFEESDLIEEIVRIRGVDQIEARQMPLKKLPQPKVSIRQAAARYLTHSGFHEAVSFSFTDMRTAELFGKKDLLINIENPITEELTTMRPSALSTLLKAVADNARRAAEAVPLFEVGPVFGNHLSENQTVTLTALWAGKKSQPHWREQNADITVFDIKDHLMATLQAAGVQEQNIQITREAPNYYHPGRSGALKQGPRTLAFFGEIHPEILKYFDINLPACAFEVFLDHLNAPKKKAIRQASDLQKISKDFAFVVDKSLEVGKIYQTLWNKLTRQASFPKGIELERVNIFDIFTGFKEESMHNKKSVAFSLTLQPYEKTIDEIEMTQIMQTVTSLIEKETGGKLRQ